MNSKVFLFGLFYTIAVFSNSIKAQTLIINEVSQGPSGSKEYIELLVVPTANQNCNSTCLDMRGWIIDDNNGFFSNGTTTGTGVASGAVRFTTNSIWSCVPIGTLIVIYNNGDVNASLTPNDLSTSDNNCKLVLPVNSTLLEYQTASPNNAGNMTYPTTGWTAGGSTWFPLGMANSDDSFQIYSSSNTTVPVFGVSWGNNNSNNIIYFSGSATNLVFMFSNTNSDDPYLQSNWMAGTCGTPNLQTPGLPNNAANSSYITSLTNSCQAIQPLTGSISVVNSTCNCNGSLTVTASGSVPGYTYEWFDASNSSIGQSTSLSNLCPGTYHCVIKSLINCTDTIYATVVNNELPNPLITANGPLVFCPGGSVTLSSSSSTGNSWSTSETTQSTVVTVSDSIVLSVSDVNGCIRTDSVVVSVLTTSDSSLTMTTCVNNLPYTWNGITFNNAGTQSQTLTAVNGCDSVVTLTLNVLNVLTSDSYDTICESSLPYSWNLLNFNASGSQSITFFSVNGCDSIATLHLFVKPIFNVTIDSSICADQLPLTWNGLQFLSSGTQSGTLSSVNGCDSIVTMNLTVLQPSYMELKDTVCSNLLPYTWDGFVFQGADSISEVLVGQNGCDSVVMRILSLNSLPQITSFTGGANYCQGDVVNPIFLQISGAPNYSIQYSINGVSQTLNQSNGTFNLGNAPGIYQLIQISDDNCSETSSMIQTIEVFPIPNSPLAFSDTTYCRNDVPVAMTAVGTGTIFWYSDLALTNLISNGNSLTPNLSQSNANYYVTQTENGCESPASAIQITVIDCEIIVPTAFTPDGDNVNDNWILDGIDVIFPKNIVYIYNRLGNIIYQSQQGKYETNSWDGKYDEKQMPVGSYYFIIEFNDGQTQNKTGIVSIIK
jgi:gliding motility-associated-like protein